MRRLFTYLSVLLLLGALSCQKELTLEEQYPDQNAQPDEPGEIKVMTFNIRQRNDNDGAWNYWAVRAPACRIMVEVQKPTLIGYQEFHSTQIEYMSGTLAEKGYVTVEDEENKNAFMYNPDILDLETNGIFFLSETPEVSSLSWDGYVRYVTWAIMSIKATGDRFFYINTHLGLTADSRNRAMNLIVKRLKTLNPEDLPVVFMADFNTVTEDKVFDNIRKTMVCTRDVAPITDDVKTYNGWNSAKNTPYICDHIWITNTIGCSEYRTVTVPYDGHTLISDHYPVYSIIKF